MTNKKYVSKPIDPGKNTDTSDFQQIVTSQEFELYRSSTDRHQSRVLTLFIFNRSSPGKSSNSIDLQQIVTRSIDLERWTGDDLLTINRELEQLTGDNLLTISRVGTLDWWRYRSSPVKCSNSIDRQQIVTSPTFELYWSSTDRLGVTRTKLSWLSF
jgi:hypothetical protein